ncbi:MAG: hypothetical protein HYX47_02040 [Burkholderiales bacterium]|nr:hypothetical protein [Burkholderiales bacterium]
MRKPILFLSPIASIAISVLLAVLFWFIVPTIIGRALAGWEVAALVALAAVLLEWLRLRGLQNERLRLEELRDSALW